MDCRRFVVVWAGALLLAAAVLSSTCSSKTYTAEQFERLVKGKTKEQVLEAVGKPKRVVERQLERRTYWYYVYKTYDPSTGRRIPQTEVIFRNGKAIKITGE